MSSQQVLFSFLAASNLALWIRSEFKDPRWQRILWGLLSSALLMCWVWQMNAMRQQQAAASYQASIDSLIETTSFAILAGQEKELRLALEDLRLDLKKTTRNRNPDYEKQIKQLQAQLGYPPNTGTQP